MTELETRLREALHDDVAERHVDVLLGDVRRGARRRRVRRTTSVAAVAALILAGAVGVTAGRHDTTQPTPSHRAPAVRNGIADLSVTGSGERIMAVRDDACASPCTAVWSQRGGGSWVRRGTIPDLTAQVTVAPDGRNGWATGQTGVWSTHDAGRTWDRVPTFDYPRMGGVGIMTGPEVAWAMLPGTNRPQLWRTPVTSDDWTRVLLPKVSKDTQMQNVLPDSRVVLGRPGVVKDSTQRVLVVDDTTWQHYSIPCYHVPQLLKGRPSTRAELCGLANLPGRIEGQPLVFSGAAPIGSSVAIGMVTTPDRPVGPVRTLYVAGHRAVVYGPDGRTPAHLELAPHELLEQFAITGEHAVLSTSRGRVFASDDGGLTWELLP